MVFFFFYKGGLYNVYKTRDEAIRSCVLYPLRWKRSERAAISSKLSLKCRHEENHNMQDIAFPLLKYFVIGSLTTLLYLIVI